MAAEQKYTKEGFKKLQDEYDYLTKVRMEEIKVLLQRHVPLETFPRTLSMMRLRMSRLSALQELKSLSSSSKTLSLLRIAKSITALSDLV